MILHYDFVLSFYTNATSIRFYKFFQHKKQIIVRKVENVVNFPKIQNLNLILLIYHKILLRDENLLKVYLVLDKLFDQYLMNDQYELFHLEHIINENHNVVQLHCKLVDYQSLKILMNLYLKYLNQ
jgi:hypothetical protein